MAFYYNFSEVPLPITPGVEYKGSLNHDGWFIGDNGTVLSCHRNVGCHLELPRFKDSYKELRYQLNRFTGYKHVCFKNSNKKSNPIYIHKLVLKAFVGPAPEGMECRHLDDNKLNNNLSNLKWGTYKENGEDAVKFGKSASGERNGHCVMSTEQVLHARELRKQGIRYVRIIDLMRLKFGVEFKYITVYQAITGISWKHLE